MPQLGEAIAEAVVRTIRVKPNQKVVADQDVIEVETNKANLEVMVPVAGEVVEIVAKLDQSYPVGAALAYLEVSAEDAETAGFGEESEPEEAREPSGDNGDDLHFAVNENDIIEKEEEPWRVSPTVGLPVPANATGATYLSPRMKARMQELGLNASDLSGIAGTGAGGRVTVEDFERFIKELDDHAQSDASSMRIAVADSMRRSWFRPLATVGRPVLLDRLLLHRKSTNPRPGPALYLIRALAIAIAENTAVGGRLVGEKIVHPKAIDIGFAVEVDDGVMVPVIRDVDEKPLSEMVKTYNELVERARERKLPPDVYGGGLATVTNFGTFGLVWATPIPLPEQNLVLGLGAGRKKPVWSNETETFVPVVEAEITLSFDHRVLDGGAAGRLLQRVSELLQKPEEL
tara:strand:+ start:1456 stop:2664 length:1209 start_codon:yes stop_codon:yes gene_type:complete